ncbi:hypothetical protein H1C71_034986 [Ictidomys tridecemlineatus]|nr:hypothetical protein H1C71_034986 [Ictidomys tridecemlineatus]
MCSQKPRAPGKHTVSDTPQVLLWPQTPGTCGGLAPSTVAFAIFLKLHGERMSVPLPGVPRGLLRGVTKEMLHGKRDAGVKGVFELESFLFFFFCLDIHDSRVYFDCYTYMECNFHSGGCTRCGVTLVVQSYVNIGK